MLQGVLGDLLADVLRAVGASPHGRAVVGVDGVDGAGKSTFADLLAEALTARVEASRLRVVRVSTDDHLHPSGLRYRRGRDSPTGFFEDSYDLTSIRVRVLDSFRAEGRWVRRIHDLATDRAVEPFSEHSPEPTVLVLDGPFLHRDELVDALDVGIFLDVPFEVSVARMAARDGSHPDPEHPSVQRYVEGQRIYLRRCRPRERARWLLDHTGRPDSPVVLRGPDV